jgi:hypothetical protein
MTYLHKWTMLQLEGSLKETEAATLFLLKSNQNIQILQTHIYVA